MRGGSKNGSAATVTPTVLRRWSTVSSMARRVPGAAAEEETVARAIIFLSVGDQVLLVAFPTWSRSRYTGTETREAVAGSWGARPASS